MAKDRAVKALKETLRPPPVLRAPDYELKFVVQCYASNRGMGFILSQTGYTGGEDPDLHASRTLSTREEA